MVDVIDRSKSRPVPCGLVSTLKSLEIGESIVVPGGKKSALHPAAKRAGICVTLRTLANGTVCAWRIPSNKDARSTLLATHADTKSIFSADTKNIFGDDVGKSASRISATPKPSPAYFKSTTVYETTVADPALGFPEGYYIQDDPYGSRIWVQGRPPDENRGSQLEVPVKPASKKSIFD